MNGLWSKDVNAVKYRWREVATEIVSIVDGRSQEVGGRRRKREVAHAGDRTLPPPAIQQRLLADHHHLLHVCLLMYVFSRLVDTCSDSPGLAGRVYNPGSASSLGPLLAAALSFACSGLLASCSLLCCRARIMLSCSALISLDSSRDIVSESQISPSPSLPRIIIIALPRNPPRLERSPRPDESSDSQPPGSPIEEVRRGEHT